ncbi:thiolase domain-containing protein [Amycolatopsis pigmentata]|uniref:Thiolase domain-containing protein n=1 Tax=Amycolatopsis pigmentata TaxID=450801 RepID=A0ABW5FLZ8_9PSEU
MTGIRGRALIAGAYEHPKRKLPDVSIGQIYADVAHGALADAGLRASDVDALYCDVTIGGLSVLSLSEYLGLQVSHVDSTDTGGSSYLAHVGHAAEAIAAGKVKVALILLAGRAASGRGRGSSPDGPPESGFERPFGGNTVGEYALAARRHMYEFGTTSAELAEIKVAASHHAQYNPNALLRKLVTVEEVLESPMVADPLHRLDSCVMTDGGGALVLVSPEVARDLDRTCVKVLGHGEAVKHSSNGAVDLTYSAAVRSGPAAFAEAGVTPSDIDYVSIYDSFTITVLLALEDLGFCEKGKGGQFVRDGRLQAPFGGLPFNTDGGGLCNNHPANRGGMTKVIEAVRQLRGEANPEVQVPNCRLALAHGNGGSLATRAGAATVILGTEDA